MRISTIFAALALSAGAFAQTPPERPQPRIDEVKTYLTLTDSQVRQLQQLTATRMEANQSRSQEIGTKQQQLQALLQANSTDAAALGRLLIDIEALRKQMQTTDANFLDQAVGLLTAAQKTKLKALEDASKLAPTIQQAMVLHLLTGPAPRPGGPMGGGPLSGGMQRPPMPRNGGMRGMGFGMRPMTR